MEKIYKKDKGTINVFVEVRDQFIPCYVRLSAFTDVILKKRANYFNVDSLTVMCETKQLATMWPLNPYELIKNFYKHSDRCVKAVAFDILKKVFPTTKDHFVNQRYISLMQLCEIAHAIADNKLIKANDPSPLLHLELKAWLLGFTEALPIQAINPAEKTEVPVTTEHPDLLYVPQDPTLLYPDDLDQFPVEEMPEPTVYVGSIFDHADYIIDMEEQADIIEDIFPPVTICDVPQAQRIVVPEGKENDIKFPIQVESAMGFKLMFRLPYATLKNYTGIVHSYLTKVLKTKYCKVEALENTLDIELGGCIFCAEGYKLEDTIWERSAYTEKMAKVYRHIDKVNDMVIDLYKLEHKLMKGDK